MNLNKLILSLTMLFGMPTICSAGLFDLFNGHFKQELHILSERVQNLENAQASELKNLNERFDQQKDSHNL